MDKHLYVDKIILKTRKGWEKTYFELVQEAAILSFTENRTVEFEWQGITQQINPEDFTMKMYSEWREEWELTITSSVQIKKINLR